MSRRYREQTGLVGGGVAFLKLNGKFFIRFWLSRFEDQERLTYEIMSEAAKWKNETESGTNEGSFSHLS